jgi:hypothetical protein
MKRSGQAGNREQSRNVGANPRIINDEIVALSRRNSNVRSLALSLGRKRVVVAECDDQLTALEQALAKRGFPATP